MLVKFYEHTIHNFLIPSFTLAKGEIAIIQFPNGPLFYPVTSALIDILTGKVVNDKVAIVSPLRYVEHFKESWFRYHFLPMTVGAYHNKYANKKNPIYKKIYDIKWITPKIRVNTLAGNPRRQLSLYTALSWTNDIIFDLAGVDPKGGQEIYNFVKTIVQSGGSAILLDCCDEFKNDCNIFIQAKYVSNQL